MWWQFETKDVFINQKIKEKGGNVKGNVKKIKGNRDKKYKIRKKKCIREKGES